MADICQNQLSSCSLMMFATQAVSNKTKIIQSWIMRKFYSFMRSGQAWKLVFYLTFVCHWALQVTFIQRHWGFVRYDSLSFDNLSKGRRQVFAPRGFSNQDLGRIRNFMEVYNLKEALQLDIYIFLRFRWNPFQVGALLFSISDDSFFYCKFIWNKSFDLGSINWFFQPIQEADKCGG